MYDDISDGIENYQECWINNDKQSMQLFCWKNGKPEILSKMVKDVSRYSESWKV
jgi:hypothetical protein